MAVIQGRTREQLRVAVGDNLGKVVLSSVTGNTGASTTVFQDSSLAIYGNDDFNGWWIVFTGPTNNDGVIRRVSDFAQSGGGHHGLGGRHCACCE